MLTELYQYAMDHTLSARPGFKLKQIKCYVQLSPDGCFLGIESHEGRTMAPDIGGLAFGPSCCNILVEKALYPLCILTGDGKKDINTPAKHAFYLKTIREGSICDPAFHAIDLALSDAATRRAITDSFCERYKPTDVMGFEVSGVPVEAGGTWLEWWDAFRKRLEKRPKQEETPVCLITGRNAPAMETVTKVGGLLPVGGHMSGDAFLCFDKDAFTSYGLKKGANAPVSEVAMTGVNAALTELIGRARIFGGSKLVYWYSRDIPADQDPLGKLLGQDLFESVDAAFPDDREERTVPKAKESAHEADAAETAVRQAVGEARKEERPAEFSGTHYYIMPISGMNGRMMVRGWYEGSYRELCDRIGQWYDDLGLALPGGRGNAKPPGLERLCLALIKPGGDPRRVFERMEKELSALQGRLFEAAVNDRPLPDAAAARALYTLRSRLTEAVAAGEEGRRGGRVPLTVYQMLKCWLVRKQRQRGEVIMEKQLKQDYPGAAYHCGRLMAVYAAIQREALGRDLGPGVVERYFGAAIVSPRYVLGNLSKLSNYHLSQIENPNYSLRFQRMLGDISMSIGPDSIPRWMSMEQQTEFALGYYQQNAAIYTRAEAGQSPESKLN